MSLNPYRADTPDDVANPVSSNGANHVVLMVEDHQNAQPELKQALELKGYRVIDTDNGQEAARQASQAHPDLLVVNMDIPLLYGLMAARQIIKHAQVGPMPAVIVIHEDVVDPAPLMELGASRNEYVTRLSYYEDLQYLLDYLLPVLPPADDDGQETSLRMSEPIPLPLLPASAPEPHPRRGAGLSKPESALD